MSMRIDLTPDELLQLALVFQSQWRRPPTQAEFGQLVEPHIGEFRVVGGGQLAGWAYRTGYQALLACSAELIRQPASNLVALDGPDATSVGVLLAASRTSDIADAHVVICARRNGEQIVTSDPDDLRRLDPGASLIVI